MSSILGLASLAYLRWPSTLADYVEVTELQDVINAYQEISRAEERYRAAVRAAIADGVPQVAIAKALDRTREMIRRDAMTEEQRDELRRAEGERLRKRREQLKARP